ncbi:hypothetical protein [Flavobacterium luteolum]|uniref:hypothetical protein n=1 Tax=Flavobacterium luteolum TaxID=3003259 RepID=UPI00248D7581|nr:hypothetical protein [Flavobacterium luteolum]
MENEVVLKRADIGIFIRLCSTLKPRRGEIFIDFHKGNEESSSGATYNTIVEKYVAPLEF